METKKKKSKLLIKSISNLLKEFDESFITPNTIFMTYSDFELLKTNCPYLIVSDKFLVYNKVKLKVIFTAQKETIGVAFAFDINSIEEYSKQK